MNHTTEVFSNDYAVTISLKLSIEEKKEIIDFVVADTKHQLCKRIKEVFSEGRRISHKELEKAVQELIIK